jgi:hypothetical protein
MAIVPGTPDVLAVGAIGLTFGGDSGTAVLEYTP